MSWVKLDDRFPRHRRVRELKRDTNAKWLHVVALCHCAEHLTDGHVDAIALDIIMADAELTRAAVKRCLPKLEDAGLWVQDDATNGWVIRDYLDYNPSASDTKAKRDVRAEAGRLGGLRSGASRRAEANSEASAEANASALLEANVNPVPVPVPVPKDLTTHTAREKALKVDGKIASKEELEWATDILQAFNEVFETRFTAREFVAKIIMRCREHPTLSVGEHRAAIARSFAAPWWTDSPSPAVVYGNEALFEKALSAVGTPVNGSKPNMKYGRSYVSSAQMLAKADQLDALADERRQLAPG